MEKYADIIKAMAECAGPDCGVTCPYRDKSAGGKSCRVLLLEDAMRAIANEEARADAAEKGFQEARRSMDAATTVNNTLRAERGELVKECEELKDYARALEKEGQEARAARDKLNQELTAVIQQGESLAADIYAIREVNKSLRQECQEAKDSLRAAMKECDILHERCQVQQNEINALLLKNGEKDAKTDRPSVCFDGNAAYWCGRADALAEVVGHMFEGEVPCK